MQDYRVKLDLYSGPLDLLLYLVRREELDIEQLPVARVVRQFLEFLDVLTELNIDDLGDFVVLASSLVELKSRRALPQESQPAAEADAVSVATFDPRTELVQQLLEYRRFRDAATELEEHASEWQQRYPRLADDRPNEIGNPADDRIKDVELWDLVSALSRVLKSNTAGGHKTVVYDDTPISVYIERIRTRVALEKRVTFTSLFDNTSSRSKITGIFLAILELLRHYQYRAEQADSYGEIYVLAPEEGSLQLLETQEIQETSSLDDAGDSSSSGAGNASFLE